MADEWPADEMERAKSVDALAARYDRLCARIRDHDAANIPVPPELACEQERLRRQLDGLMED